MDTSQLSLLDNVRLSNGPEGLRNYYRDLLRTDREKALKLVNDRDIQFRTLYLLAPELYGRSVRNELEPLYGKALDVAEALSGKVSRKAVRKLRPAFDSDISTLRWIVRTGLSADEPDDKFDSLLERSAAILVKSLKDTAILPELADMIFDRNRRERLIHELVWVFFEARSPESLLLLAQRLNSADDRDVDLAKKLLCFIPGVGEMHGHSGPTLYSIAVGWLEENKPFLYYTGESLHLCSSPEHYAVSWPAKYLCRSVSADSGDPLTQLRQDEKEKLSGFAGLPEFQQRLVADFSYMLYRRNFHQWDTWISLPVDEQAALAIQSTGGPV